MTLTPPIAPRVDDPAIQRVLRELSQKIVELQNAVNKSTATPAISDFDATHDGTVPASGGGAVNYLRADGTWAVPGTSVGTGDVPHTRRVDTTGALQGGGDLSADRTHDVKNNGIDDARLRQGTGTSVIGRGASSPGNVADIAATAAGQVLGTTGGDVLAFVAPTAEWFGNGSDGSLHFIATGSTTVAGATLSSGVYTMQRDVCATDCTVDTGVEIQTNGFRFMATGTLTLVGRITDNGSAAIGATGGLVRSAQFFPARLAGANGGSGAASGGTTAGVGSTLFPYVPSQSTVTQNNSGNGPGQGGGGGQGDPAGHTGGASTALTQSGPTNGQPTLSTLFTGRYPNGTQFNVASGGGGGGSETGSVGGGGGGAGGYPYVGARVLAGTGTVEAAGGAGAAATGSGTGAGGGGGGGGGIVPLVYETATGSVAGVVTGGAGGAKQGTGHIGGAGHDGSVERYCLSGDGT